MSTVRPFAHAIDLLKRSGLRPTRQRIALAKLLFERENRHMTAEQLHEEVLGAKVAVSLATVYNALHQFTNAGLLREVVVEPGRSYFDTNTGDHHHFYYEDDSSLEDIPSEAVAITRMPSAPSGTTISRVDVVVRLSRTGKSCF